ncbi:HD-GYP domain-containing protein [Paenibacillus sp. BSR1-1]|uniref:HD-GYP domain-containing protein n=1 Tax=Paenibacillus sp. BSR1-1 TaxID=3020845 RepID=UPI0025B0B857|nr:HD-GYP domain-containing protein [Paenibacillus sp. BSR1-1]MDN3016099.1 HD-GYP domain-containing protein [Paenibacillus sp. BSR1-1]
MIPKVSWKLNISLENASPFRYGFFIILFLLPFINYHLTLSKEIELFPLYLIAPILLGIGFWDKSKLFLVSFSIVIVSFRLYLTQEPTRSIVNFVILAFVYMLITFISVHLTKIYRKSNRNKLEFILSLAKSMDSRDSYTASHSEKVAKYALMIAKELKLSNRQCEAVYIGGLLHDIGKIGVPESILLKPSQLTNEEFDIIKRHPVIGYKTMEHVSAFRENGVLDIVLYHHERYDGKGYPYGKKGEEIPLAARIIAVADTFDAMTTRRVYRNQMDLEYVYNEINSNKGLQFDPLIADVFLKILKKQGTKILTDTSDELDEKGMRLNLNEQFG